MNKRDFRQIYRAKFSSTTDEDLISAFNNLTEFPNNKLSLSVDARQTIDFKIGIIISNFLQNYVFDLIIKSKFDEISGLSYGPCQTPALKLCVDRHYQIKNFKTQKYYELVFQLGNHVVVHKLDSWNQDQFELAVGELKVIDRAIVILCDSKKEIVQPPFAMNTEEMLVEACNYIEIGPYEIMDIAEKLYNNGYISYPRTDNTKYSNEVDISQILKSLSAIDDYKDFIKKIRWYINN